MTTPQPPRGPLGKPHPPGPQTSNPQKVQSPTLEALWAMVVQQRDAIAWLECDVAVLKGEIAQHRSALVKAWRALDDGLLEYGRPMPPELRQRFIDLYRELKDHALKSEPHGPPDWHTTPLPY